MMRLVHLRVPEKRFDHILTVVKGSLDCNIVYIGVQHRRHLCRLNGTNFSIGEHDEDAHILLAPETVDGGTTCVAAGGAYDSKMMSGMARFEMRVFADEEKFKQITEELECHVFEGERWAMEQLEQV